MKINKIQDAGYKIHDTDCIMPLASCLLHHVSCIMPLASCLLYHYRPPCHLFFIGVRFSEEIREVKILRHESIPSLVVLFFVLFWALISGEAHGEEKQKEEIRIQAKGLEYNRATFTAISGEVAINPAYTGSITEVRFTTPEGEPLKEQPRAKVAEMKDGWYRVSVPDAISKGASLQVVGDVGILELSPNKKPSSKGASSEGAAGLRPISEPLVFTNGRCSTTFYIPQTNISQPTKFRVGIFDWAKNEYIVGNIVALKSDQVAVSFRELPNTVVSKEGKIVAILARPDGDPLEMDAKGWGYNIIMNFDPLITEPAPMKLEIFGLSPDTKVRVTLKPIEGQTIKPLTNVLTVAQINSGALVATVSTTIAAPQPLNILVEPME